MNLILEEAQKPTQNIALFSNKQGIRHHYVLVDVNEIELLNPASMKKKNSYGWVDRQISMVIIVGMIRVIHPTNATNATVDVVAAKKGWGPVLYDIAMSEEGGLAPDPNNVSPDAMKVWNYYFYKRKDVKKQILNKDNDPNNPLNYAYFINNQSLSTQLEHNFEKIRDIIEDNDIPLANHAANFFSMYYKKWE